MHYSINVAECKGKLAVIREIRRGISRFPGHGGLLHFLLLIFAPCAIMTNGRLAASEKPMRRKITVAVLGLASLSLLAGCVSDFAANQGRRQAARSADHYVKTYAEPEIYGDDQQAGRQARNDLADTIVRTGNERQKTRVGVNDRGYLTNER